jgi:hypothetical protein
VVSLFIQVKMINDRIWAVGQVVESTGYVWSSQLIKETEREILHTLEYQLDFHTGKV